MNPDEAEPGPVRLMSDEEQALAEDFYDAIQRYSRYDDRGQQTAEYRVGISDLGFCSERTRRMLKQMDPDDTDLLPAFIGTAIGDHAERAYGQKHPNLLIQPEVQVTLKGERNTYLVPGHPDIVDPAGRVIDVKTTRGLEVPRRKGPSQQQQFQRHLYALGAYESNLLDCAIWDVEVSNVWLDRAGDDRAVYVHTEKFSPEIVEQAQWWLDEVVYAYTQDQPARKEPPYEMCAKVCGFFEDCRGMESDVEGLLTDDEVLVAVDMYAQARALEKEAKRLKDQATPALRGIKGSTGEWSVRWTHINGTHVEYDKKPYERLDIRKIK